MIAELLRDCEVHIAALSLKIVSSIRHWDRRGDYMALKMNRQERLKSLKAKINEAWDDPRPTLTADEIFEQLEKHHLDAVAASLNRRAIRRGT